MRVALGQFNAVVGDLAGNAGKMCEIYARAIESKVDLLVFPECALCGYPPEDLLHKRHFLDANSRTLDKLAADCPDMTIIVGFAGRQDWKNYNCAAVIQDGSINRIYRKGRLPTFGVFDEQRYFEPGKEPVVISVCGINVVDRKST